MMIASIVDITERKKIEADLKKSEEQYRLFLQNFTGIAYRGNIDSSPEFYHGAVANNGLCGSRAFKRKSFVEKYHLS